MNIGSLKKHFAAGDKVDLPGNCKWCGERVAAPGVHVMRDPSGGRAGIDFCSAECLRLASGIFDGLTDPQLKELDQEITRAERERN